MQIVKQDIDGEWVYFTDPQPHYGKVLPISTACQLFDPAELGRSLPDLVSAIEPDINRGELTIHYHRGLEPLELLRLRELLHLTGPLAAWRATAVALQLCRCLAVLHELDIPQTIVHPERIGQKDGKLVLIPTVPGILPRLSKAIENPAAGWIHYIAPEILRTRGLSRELLFRGDIYALGRTLEAMCMTSAQGLPQIDCFEMAARRVESAQSDRLGDLSPSLWRLGTLVTRMCSAMPDQRPELAEVIAELTATERKQSPEEVFRGFEQARQIREARECLTDLKEAQHERVFQVSNRTFQLMEADLLMMEPAPPYGRVAMLLEAAEAPDKYEVDVQLRMARVYANYVGHSDHLRLSCESYLRACGRTDWPADVQEEWCKVLAQMVNLEEVLDLSSDVPPSRRIWALQELRLRRMLDADQPLDAWYEIVPAFVNKPLEASRFDLLVEVARRNNPLDLVKWCHQHDGMAGHELLLAAAWKVCGNDEKALEYLERLAIPAPPEGGN